MLSRIPFHKRQQNRVKLFWWVLKPVQSFFNGYLDWFKDTLFKANSTGQVISLEAFLNHFVDGANGGISVIESSEDGGVYLGNRDGDTLFFTGLGNRGTDEKYIELSIRGEISTLLPADFRIIAPSSANVAQIRKYVEQYKLAGKYFDIKQY